MIAPLEADAGVGARFLPAALAPGVHAAWADGRLIFLDVLRDRYFRLDSERSAALSATGSLSPAAARACAHLEAKGLIRAARSDALRKETSPAISFARTPINLAQLFGVWSACAWASYILKTRCFSAVLAAAPGPRTDKGVRAHKLDAARVFLAHRALYPRDYGCLFEALALKRYLAQRGYGALWVFGVRGAPFAAHCWLESEGLALNDDPDNVGAFNPILAV